MKFNSILLIILLSFILISPATALNVNIQQPSTTNFYTGNLTNLSELADVNIPSPADGEVLSWDIATSKWIASEITTCGAETDPKAYNGTLAYNSSLNNYYLKTNPFGFYNSTTLPAGSYDDSWINNTFYNKTQSDGRYLQSYTETDPKWTANFTAYNSSWTSTYNVTYQRGYEYSTNGTYYLVTNPSNYITDGNTNWDNSYGFITNGTMNKSVAWASIIDVPASLSDGDNDTTYTAGSNLSLSGNQFDLNVSSLVSYLNNLYQATGAYLTSAVQSLTSANNYISLNSSTGAVQVTFNETKLNQTIELLDTDTTYTNTSFQLNQIPVRGNIDMYNYNLTNVSCVNFNNGATWCSA